MATGKLPAVSVAPMRRRARYGFIVISFLSLAWPGAAPAQEPTELTLRDALALAQLIGAWLLPEIERLVQRQAQLDHAQVAGEVSRTNAEDADQLIADLLGQLLQLGVGQSVKCLGRVNGRKNCHRVHISVVHGPWFVCPCSFDPPSLTTDFGQLTTDKLAIPREDEFS